MNKRILLIGSSTGGHIYPIIALGEFLKEFYDIKYLGIKNQMEEKIFPEDSYFLNIEKNYKKNIFNIKFYRELKKYKTLLSDFDAYISSGGISTFIMAKICKNKPSFILEQNVVLGDANRFYAHKVKKIFLSYDLHSSKKKYVLTGNPSYTRFKKRKTIKNKIIFMFGSLSSETLVFKTLNYFNSPLFLNEYEYVIVYKYPLNLSNKKIKQVTYLNVEEYLDSSNLFFSRGGGSSSYELMKYGIKTVFIPSPFVKHNHQEKNVIYFEKYFSYPFILEKNYNSLTIRESILKFFKSTRFKKCDELKTNELIKKVIDEYLS